MCEAVGRLSEEGLDEPFGLSLGLWGVGPCEDVADGQQVQGFGETAGTLGAAVIGHHLFGPDALVAKPAQGAQQEAGGGVAALVGQHLDIGQPRGVIDGDRQPRPPVATADAGAGDAMARPLALIAPRRFRRVDICVSRPSRPTRLSQRDIVERARPSFAAIAAPVIRRIRRR